MGAVDASVKLNRMESYWIIMDKQNQKLDKNEIHCNAWISNTQKEVKAISLLDMVAEVVNSMINLLERSITLFTDNMKVADKVNNEQPKANGFA